MGLEGLRIDPSMIKKVYSHPAGLEGLRIDPRKIKKVCSHRAGLEAGRPGLADSDSRSLNFKLNY